MTKEKVEQYRRYFILIWLGAIVGAFLSSTFGDWVAKYDPLVWMLFIVVNLLAWVADRYLAVKKLESNIK